MEWRKIMRGNCRKILAILLLFGILFQNPAMEGILAANASLNIGNTITTTASGEESPIASYEETEEEIEEDTTEEETEEDIEEDTTEETEEDIEEDTTEEIEEDIEEDTTEEETEERLYTVADFINYAYSCPTLTAVETVEQAEINSDEKAITGKILVLGNEGEALSNELSQRGTSTVYTGSQLPATIKIDYVDDISMLASPFAEYDLLLLEESAQDIGLTSQEFLTLAQLSNTIIIYDTTLLYKYHTINGDFHFDDNTGTLLINTAEPFAGTESYRSGGIKHERPLSIKGITAQKVKEVKYLPTYPSESIALGYEEDSLKVNTKAEKIVLPDSITTLKSGFLEFTTLQDINLEHVVTIADNTFEGCTSLEEVDLSAAQSIGKAAFKNDEKLEITAFHPDTKLNMNSFENACTGSIKLPENLEVVPALCFESSHLTEVQFGAKLKEIRVGAFYKTYSLTEINMPDSITYIGSGAFQYSGLKYIDFNVGSSDVILKEQAFGDCQDLIHVNFRLKNRESCLDLLGAFVNSPEEADYKISCQENSSKNQIFSGAYNNPEKDYFIHTNLGSRIRYIGSITLDANEGSVRDIAVVYGQVYNHLPTPTRQGYRFTGWYDGETEIQNEDTIPLDRGDITLTARWEKNAGGDILSSGDEARITEVGGDHSGVSSWETLSNTQVYYQNIKLETVFKKDNNSIFYSQLNSFSRTDKINAEKLFNQIYNTPSTYTEVVLNPKGVVLNAKEYKKYKIIDTGLETDSFIRAITLMNVMYFQNLIYMHRIKNNFLTAKDKTVTSYSDLLVGITPSNSTTLWQVRDLENKIDNNEMYRVNDFEEDNLDDGKLHYEIEIGIFREYYNRCKKVDDELNVAAETIGLNQNTSNIKVSDAVTRINAYIHDNFAYDHFYKSWDLYWFFQPDNPQGPDVAELLEYYHNNEGDNQRNHHGICQSYAFFASALFAKYGCWVPPYTGCEDGVETHMFNQLFINGEPLYIDYCWNANANKKLDYTQYLFLSEGELDCLSDHKNPTIAPAFQVKVDFNNQYPKETLKKETISKVKNKSEKKAVIKYKKVAEAEKYQIQYSQNKNFSEAKSARVKGNKVIIKNLGKGKTYYFRVRAYKSSTYIKSIKVYGKWSKAKKLKIRA